MNPPGGLETEVKLRIPDLAAAGERLAALGFRPRQALQPEESVLWDRDGELLARGCALRLRRYAGSAWVTFKGPKIDHPELKIRPEHETAVADPEACAAILAALGYRPVLRMEKARAVLVRDGLVACLDDTPLGPFLELEGDPSAIRAAMAELGLGAAAIEPRSYPTLYREAGLG